MPTGTNASDEGPSRRRWPWYEWPFLVAVLSAFGLLNAFWQFLSTGSWVDFSAEAYRSAASMPVGQMLAYPLDIFCHPWMIAVTGLLFGLVTVVPVVVTVLNRLAAAMVFAMVVVVFAHAPVLGLVVAAGCILAARTSLRHEAPFLAGLLGLSPMLLYLTASTFAGEDSAALLPLQRWAQSLPFLVAFVWAVLVLAVVIGVGHLSDYRTGVVWPILVLLMAGPMWIFYTRIGPDELDYALISSRLAPGDLVFRPIRLEAWRRRSDAEGLNDQTLEIHIRDELKRRRDKLASECEGFIRKYPRSHRSPAVMWLQAQCASLSLNARALKSGQVSYTAKHPLESSAPIWRQLASRYPAAPQADLAGWRLAVLELRKQRVESADQLLRPAAEALRGFLGDRDYAGDADRTASVFSKARSIPPPDYYADALFEAERLIWLIEQNDLANDPAAARAMAEYLSLDPNCGDYAAQLTALLDDPRLACEATKLGDNLKLAVAKANPNVFERAAMLVSLADDVTDAAIEANYELGRLVMAEPVLRLEGGVEDSAAYFKRVKEAPPNPYTRRAARHLLRLVAARPDGRGQQ